MADISILPSYHSSILPFFHPSILPSCVRYVQLHVSIVVDGVACLVSWLRTLSLMESPALYRGVGRDDLIKLYFYGGYNYRLIICFLFFVHGISLSLRHLKRILQGMNLRRRMYPTSHGTISLLIQVYYNYY